MIILKHRKVENAENLGSEVNSQSKTLVMMIIIFLT